MAKLVELPQDIIDNVIAAGGDDMDLLKQCSLVSSSFLHTSRKHLFSRISIGSDETCQGIHQFLIQNPVVQTFVKAITLTESMPNWRMTPEWLNGTSLLAILRLPFCCLECFSIVLLEDDEQPMTFWLSEDVPPEYWDWNDFSSEMKDALSNIILSSTLKTIRLDGVVNVPTTFFLHVTHLTTLELHSLAPNCFYDGNSSTLPVTRAASKGVGPMASHTVIDRCVWRFGAEHAYRPIDMIFLPFMCGLRFLEIYLVLGSGTTHDFKLLTFLMNSLSISLASPEHLEFNIRFRGSKFSNLDSDTFYENLTTAWSGLDSITTHPTSSRLQRVDVNIIYVLHRERDDGAEPADVKDKVLNAVFCGLPLLHKKGILFVEAVLEE